MVPRVCLLSCLRTCVYVSPRVWLKVVARTGVMKRGGPRSLAFQNTILHHGSCQPDGRCSGMGNAHSNEVKCALWWMVMRASPLSVRVCMCVCMCGIATSPAFYCCPLVSQWRLTTQILWGVAKRKYSIAKDGVTSDRKHCKKNLEKETRSWKDKANDLVFKES